MIADEISSPVGPCGRTVVRSSTVDKAAQPASRTSGRRATAVRTRAPRAAVASTLAALAVLASACSMSGSPSTVAYVGDTRVTQRQLDTALSGVQQTLQAGQQVSPSAVVNVMIHGALADQIAATNGLTITDTERDAVIKGSNLAPLLNVPDAKPIAYDLADQQLVAQAVGQDAYLKSVQGIAVDLNPRFGVLDPAQKTIVDGQSSSLSLPVSGS
jgi:hypothetical protein